LFPDENFQIDENFQQGAQNLFTIYIFRKFGSCFRKKVNLTEGKKLDFSGSAGHKVGEIHFAHALYVPLTRKMREIWKLGMNLLGA
jgi:hypothetical protein